MPIKPRIVAPQMRAKGRLSNTAQADRGHSASLDIALVDSKETPFFDRLDLQIVRPTPLSKAVRVAAERACRDLLEILFIVQWLK